MRGEAEKELQAVAGKGEDELQPVTSERKEVQRVKRGREKDTRPLPDPSNSQG